MFLFIEFIASRKNLCATSKFVNTEGEVLITLTVKYVRSNLQAFFSVKLVRFFCLRVLYVWQLVLHLKILLIVFCFENIMNFSRAFKWLFQFRTQPSPVPRCYVKALTILHLRFFFLKSGYQAILIWSGYLDLLIFKNTFFSFYKDDSGTFKLFEF